MGNCFTNQEEGTEKCSESLTKENTDDQEKNSGFGRFKVEVADMLSLRDVVTLATYLCFAKGVVDRLERSRTPGLDIIHEMETREYISPTDISRILDALKKCDRVGIACKVEHCYQNNVSFHHGRQPLTLEGKKNSLIRLLKLKYKILYDAVQPLPYVRDKMCCVDKIFIQGNIQQKSKNKRGNESSWQAVDSYHDILTRSRKESARCIILGDPGYGKSTLSLQFLYDWCNQIEQSPLKDVDIVIFFRMRQLGGLTSICEAIKQLSLPTDSSLTVEDIKEILENTKSTTIFFDGYDEYPDRKNSNTDFSKILRMTMLVDTHVILTTRSANVRDTPNELKTQSTQFKLTGFSEVDQDKYIHKAVVGGNVDAARFVKDKLNESPILEDLCQIPLLFTIVAHITHDKKNIMTKVSSVTWFFRLMMECFFKHTSIKQDNIEVRSDIARYQLSKIAFEGLTKENQQIVWHEQFFREIVGDTNYNTLLRTGILIEDEDTYVSSRADETDFIQQLTTTSFYHKLFCESYAAFCLVDLICLMEGNVSRSSASNAAANSNWKDVTDLLSSLDHKDLQYLFRFASGLDLTAGCVIINYLVKQACDTNLAILCILEFTGEDEYITDAVTELCSSKFRIDVLDSKLLQRAKVQVLEVASRNNIPISILNPRRLFSYVDRGDIVLQSGIRLPALSSLEQISINGARAKLSEEDVVGLLNYGLQSVRFKDIWFYNCKLPKSVKGYAIPPSVKERDIKVFIPNEAKQLDSHSGGWAKIHEIQDIKRLCSYVIYIDNYTSKSVQKSVIDLLVKASIHDIPVFFVVLVKSFSHVIDDDIILNSGLSLPILRSLQNCEIATEFGGLIDKDDVHGILHHLKHSVNLRSVNFNSCLPPHHLSGSFLLELKLREVQVLWRPYGVGKRSYQLDLENGHWLLYEEYSSLFPTKSVGDVLTYEDYLKEVRVFKDYLRY